MQMDYKPGMDWRELREFLGWHYSISLDGTAYFEPSEYREVINTMHKAITDSAAPAMAKLYHHSALCAFRACAFIEALSFAFLNGVDNE